MSNDLPEFGDMIEDAEKRSEEGDKSARSLPRWWAIPPALIFCVLYFPFQSRAWGWPVAIAASYTAFVFAVALGLSLKDSDDFFGDLRVPKYAVTLLLPHMLILVPVTYLAYLWLRVVSLLPHWLIVEHHDGSYWQLCGLVFFCLAGTREGTWLSRKIKQRFGESEDPSHFQRRLNG